MSFRLIYHDVAAAEAMAQWMREDSRGEDWQVVALCGERWGVALKDESGQIIGWL